MSHPTPLNGMLQSDLDCRGHSLLNQGGGVASRKFDVKSYGAIGDGTTDDTTAIAAALAAIPSTGGVLYFPAGRYKYAGGTMTLTKQVTVEGDGGLNEFNFGTGVSTIDFNSATGTLFDVHVSGCSFKNIHLRNTSSTIPTAGAGILISGDGVNILAGSRTNYNNVTVDKFYICVDIRAGQGHVFDNCLMQSPGLYGIKQRNILSPDGGEICIANCYIYQSDAARTPSSGIRIESGGGIKIINTKIIGLGSGGFVNGIDLSVGANVVTSDLLIANCSIELCTGSGIKGTTNATNSKWGNILITGNQFLCVVSGSEYAINMRPTTAGDFTGLCITGNYANCATSGNPMIYLEKCSSVSIVGNAGAGFNAVLTTGASVTFATTAAIPPGGTTGQSLKKSSNNNYEVFWG